MKTFSFLILSLFTLTSFTANAEETASAVASTKAPCIAALDLMKKVNYQRGQADLLDDIALGVGSIQSIKKTIRELHWKLERITGEASDLAEGTCSGQIDRDSFASLLSSLEKREAAIGQLLDPLADALIHDRALNDTPPQQ